MGGCGRIPGNSSQTQDRFYPRQGPRFQTLQHHIPGYRNMELQQDHT